MSISRSSKILGQAGVFSPSRWSGNYLPHLALPSKHPDGGNQQFHSWNAVVSTWRPFN